MAVVVVLGAQWGDEGKGKVVDLLSKEAHVVVRFQGGANAGHTIVTGGHKYIFHHIPSGILYPDKTCVLGNGMVIDPATLTKEMDRLEENGVDVGPKRLKISDRAHIVLPYHKAIDLLREAQRGKPIGTTGRGIGPAYEDKVGRRGIRMAEFVEENLFYRRLKENLELVNSYIVKLLGGEKFELDEMFEEYRSLANRLQPYVTDTVNFLHECIGKGKNLLLEGAQGAHLDIDHGTYPFVTSSTTTIGGALAGSGLHYQHVSRVIGVMKAYTTRVGGGPFPTELNDEVGQYLRDRGGEYGSTTGRPRRCGWLDLAVVRRAAQLNGFTDLVITKIDVLSGLKQLKIGKGYNLNGTELSCPPPVFDEYAQCKPLYQEVDGWEEELRGIRSFPELPENAIQYVKTIEKIIGVPASMLSLSPDREDTLMIRKIF